VRHRVNHCMAVNFLAAGLSVLALTACAPVGPDYVTPETVAPAAWTQDGGRATTRPSDARGDVYSQWWLAFGDATLTELVGEAVAGNKDVAIARSRVLESRASRKSALSVLFPEVDAAGSYSRSRNSKNAVLGPFGAGIEHDDFKAGFDASWELDLWGGGRRGLEAADADLQSQRENLRDVTVSLVSEVARNYVELRGFQRRLEVAMRNIDAQKDTLGLSEARVKAGLRSDLDVAQAEALLAASRAAIPGLETSAQQAIHRLGVLLGKNPSALNPRLLKAGAIPVTPPQVPAGLPSDLLRRRPDIRRAERELAAATARVGLATAELFPRVSLTGAAGLESFSAGDFFTGGSRYWSVGPTVRWPLLTFGRIRANIDIKNQQQVQALRRYEQTVLVAFEDVENALVALGKEREHHEALAQAVDANKRSVALSTELYTRGLGDFLAVLDAERSQYSSEDALVQSDRALASAVVALYKALGGGWSAEPDKDAK
jgi:multidrug efflux system outer membrane protein